MSKYYEPLQEYQGVGPSLFLAGGVTGCPDWQRQMAAWLQDSPWVILNPRRRQSPMDDPDAAEAQINWEHRYLRRATAILFWFPCETLCPITLYELGAWSISDKPLFIGIHPQYRRRGDIEIQTGLVRPDVQIVYSLQDLAKQVSGSNGK